MSLTSYVLIPPGYKAKHKRSFQSQERFIYPRITRKSRMLSRAKKKILRNKTLLPYIEMLWQNLTPAQRNDWNIAGEATGMSGFNLFVKDKALRIKNNIPGLASPSVFHQALVGQLKIIAPSKSILLIQPHKYNYYIKSKITGKKSMFRAVEIKERLVLPLTLKINYKTNLIMQDLNWRARFYATIKTLFQGATFENNLIINIPLLSDWATQEATLSAVNGQIIDYSIYLDLDNVRGEMLFDNLKVIHSGQNWAIDPYCDKINEVFKGAFSQILTPWKAIIKPVGSSYKSVYPPD
jgi:hypothetical protein